MVGKKIMADVTIKNTKSKDESAYKTGANLSGGNGVNVNAVNPGALTGKYNDGLKNNTMNLPIRGSNFQVSIDADSEKEFENVSSIDKLFLESASAIINKDSSNSGDKPTPPTPSGNHYDWTLDVNTETMEFLISDYVEGQQLQEDDTVTVTLSDTLAGMLDIPQKVYESTAQVSDTDIVGNAYFTELNKLDIKIGDVFCKIITSEDEHHMATVFYISNYNNGIRLAFSFSPTIVPDIDLMLVSSRAGYEYNSSAKDYFVNTNLDEAKFYVGRGITRDSLLEYLTTNGYTVNESVLDTVTKPIILDNDIEVITNPEDSTNKTTLLQGTVAFYIPIAYKESQALDLYMGCYDHTVAFSKVGHIIRDI